MAAQEGGCQIEEVLWVPLSLLKRRCRFLSTRQIFSLSSSVMSVSRPGPRAPQQSQWQWLDYFLYLITQQNKVHTHTHTHTHTQFNTEVQSCSQTEPHLATELCLKCEGAIRKQCRAQNMEDNSGEEPIIIKLFLHVHSALDYLIVIQK